MKIEKIYSHLNGFEFLSFRKPKLWKEIEQVIFSIKAEKIKTSKEKTKQGQLLFSPKNLNENFQKQLSQLGWKESRFQYYVTHDEKITRDMVKLKNSEEQKIILEKNNLPLLKSHNQTDFLKDRVAIEVQFGKYAFVSYDLFVKHMAFYVADQIDVGIEIMPMKSMQKFMSTGIGYYECELYNLLRQGRGIPAVPLIVIGLSE
jgi:Restriction endonuclease BglII